MSNNLTLNLAQLQNKIKRDPPGFRDEYESQVHRFKTSLELQQLYPENDHTTLSETMIFLASTAHCYKEDMKNYGNELAQLIETSGHSFSSKLRQDIVKSLMLLRGKQMIEDKVLFELFFKLFRMKDKKIRETVHKFIVNDVKRINLKSKNHAVNKSLQNFMYTMLQDQDVTASFKSLQVTEDLYRKNVWNDEKTVNVIAAACFHGHQKIQSRALNFFLGNDQKSEDHDSDDDEDPDERRQREKNELKLPTARDIMVRFQTGKKGAKNKRKKKKMMARIAKKSNKGQNRDAINFTAIDMLHDPQSFAEKLFKQLESTNGDFALKLLHIRVIARVIGVHKLVIYNFYPYLQRFLNPSQRDVTLVLQAAAHATHDLVPPEVCEEMVRCISNQFITERNSGEVMAVGLNSVREVAARNPLAIGDDLLQDLTQYKKHIDRGVKAGAKGLITLYRQEAPMLLAKKDRGKPNEHQRQIVPYSYGQSKALDFIPGAETLPLRGPEEEEEVMEEDKPTEWVDGEWQDVEHDIEQDIEKEEIEKRTETEAKLEEKVGREELLKMKQEKAKNVLTTRVLTDAEFQKIKIEQATQKAVDIHRKVTPSSLLSAENSSNLVELKKIEQVASRRAHSKEDRLATVLAGREGREKQKLNPYASSTNKDKRKQKPFQMVMHKVAKKQTGRSYTQKKKALQESLKKQLKSYKH
ncbi:Oidioi.mRNA.OKI2018_I69.chr2.g6192.t1.cds [Oikopleura dioica]|uniref:Protein SDA1 n=1 Tax=Oikopleura dioica TaxID=34765 RepID=A0ABN7T359_OIKDI|nr:Oidioi.mRNA.OKI2018_I69.chr2.g6192.t1.cds [Oikopleura dioica]